MPKNRTFFGPDVVVVVVDVVAVCVVNGAATSDRFTAVFTAVDNAGFSIFIDTSELLTYIDLLALELLVKVVVEASPSPLSVSASSLNVDGFLSIDCFMFIFFYSTSILYLT